MYDYHTHTAFSDDCDIPMEEMIRGAIAKNIKEMAITDHFDPGYPDPEFPFLLDFPSYFEMLQQLEARYRDQIRIIKGMEIGIMEGQFDPAAEAARMYPYDMIIGSFHSLGQTDLYTCDYTAINVPAMIEEFYTYIFRCIKEYKEYDIVGHLTIIDRYVDKIYNYAPYMDIIDEILKMIIYDGKGIEINTSSFKYGTGIWLPREEVLKRYRELGGEILTFGSDSHDPAFFGDHFEEAHALAEKLGFRYFTVFRSRKPEFLPLYDLI